MRSEHPKAATANMKTDAGCTVLPIEIGVLW
jgi:hypothetical protein